MIVVALKDRKEDESSGLIAHDFLDPRITDPDQSNVKFANYYQPVRSGPFRLLLERLNPSLEYAFLDVGAGTGKAMLLAAEFGFKKVRGIEIAKDLCRDAEINFKKFGSRFPNTKFEMLHGDALNFSFNSDDGFFFLNDPFSEEVFKPFVERIEQFRKQTDREILMVYKNNIRRFMPSLEKLKSRCKYSEEDISGNLFQVFKI